MGDMIWILALALILSPTVANAAPITALFLSIGAGAGLAAVLTNITVSIGLNLAAALFAPKPKSAAPSIADARINVRLDVAPRWQMAGTVPVGGNLGNFAEYDAALNFWYIVAHGDAELTGTPSYYLDDIPVTVSNGLDGFVAGDVLTNDFCQTDGGGQYTGSGTKFVNFRLYTITPSAGAVYGALPAAFTAAFPTLPADFYLAGVCYTIVRCRAGFLRDRPTVMRWRGALGLGEPSVVVVANFNRMYDPRNLSHNIDDSTTWTASNGNPAIVWAWFRTTRYGRNRPMTEVNWMEVAVQATICDTTVLDRLGATTPLYRCGVAFPDTKPRWECETDILETADAIVVYDDEGRAYPMVGYYTAPTLQFTAARDIISAQTQIIDDGEAAVDGVVVYYLEPALNYTRQPCAPWTNPDWFTESAIPNYHTVEILGCHNHNQAVRLAKAIGTRIGATRRATLGTTIKGVLASRARAIDLDYDASFAGPFELFSAVDEDESGVTCSFAVVPLSADKWVLNAGEEGIKPAETPALGLATPSPNPPAPAALILASAAPGAAGEATVSYITANDAQQVQVVIYRGATNVFSAATKVHTAYAGANVSSFITETGLAAGVYYFWAQAQNASGIAATASGPYSVTVI